jgi:hypothetical protein
MRMAYPNIPLDEESQVFMHDLDRFGVACIQLITPVEAMRLAWAVCSYPFRDRVPTYGPREVVQNFRVCEEEEVPKDSIVRRFSKQLSRNLSVSFALLRDYGHTDYPFRSDLDFNDHLILWYAEGDVGLGAHRDHSKYRNLIVSITLIGQSRFNIHEHFDEPPFLSFKVTSGCAVFMVAPGYRGRDIRPYHSVTDVSQERIALILKQKEK